jgi:hypothetical protein
MATYDVSVILAFTDKLYAQAAKVIATYTIIGVLIGGGVGVAAGNASQIGFLLAVLGAVIVGAIAFQLGRDKAFSLRLQAQVALCQVQIEANTRNFR